MNDIFISYSRKDAAIAEKFRDSLTEEGWSIFWDVEILSGKAWSDQLEVKLNKCKCIVVLWSKHSLQSNYVKEEARAGKRANKLVPILIDSDIAPPFEFAMIEAAMLNDWDANKENREYQKLIKTISEHILPDGKTGTPAAAQQTVHTTTKRASIPISKTKTRTTSFVNANKSRGPSFAGLGLALLAFLLGIYFFLNTPSTLVNNSGSRKPVPEMPTKDNSIEDAKVRGTDKLVDNTIEINRLKKSISDINMSSKKIIDQELQDVGNKKKEIIAPGKLTSLKKTRSDLNTRMKQWVANGSSDLDQLKGIEADSRMYLRALNRSLGDIFKLTESII